MVNCRRQLLKASSWNGDSSHRRGGDITFFIYSWWEDDFCASDRKWLMILSTPWLAHVGLRNIISTIEFCARSQGRSSGLTGPLWSPLNRMGSHNVPIQSGHSQTDVDGFKPGHQAELWTQVWQSKSSFWAALDAWECSGVLIGRLSVSDMVLKSTSSKNKMYPHCLILSHGVL